MWRRLWPQLLPAPPAPPGAAGSSEPTRVVVLEQGRTPSGDYLLRPWLQRQGVDPVLLDSREPPRAGLLRPGDLVIIARYLPPAWQKQIEGRRDVLAGLVYFMDDDLLDRAVLGELPPGYAKKIDRLAMAHRAWLRRQDVRLWVSTEALAAKYADWAPQVLPMAPPAALLSRRRSVRIAYHGTTSHQGEIEWLHAVLAQVQASRSNTHVELFGDHPVHRRYRDLPRVAVLHPMSWENYLAYTATRRCDVGLAPLRPGRFNAGRGPSKFWDYARMGAVGIYADVPPYRGFIDDGVDGLLCPDDPGAWVEAILALADDADRRAAMAAAARQRASG